MTRSRRSIRLLLLIAVAALSSCSPYYGDLTKRQQRQLDRAIAARTAGDVRGACATLAEAAGGGQPALLLQHARCLMDPESGTQDLTEARAVLERAYSKHSPLKGRAASWLGSLERQSGGTPAAQVVWLERAQQLGETGADRLLLKAWAQEPQTYRPQLIAFYEETASTNPFSALELARLLADDPAIDPSIRKARIERAVRALSAGARAGNGSHARTLAWLYQTGELVPEDPAKSRLWLTEAARAGDAKAMTKLADQAQADGELAAAERWLQQAVAIGDQQAAINLSRGYLAGKFQPASRASAEELIARTASSGASPALELAYGQALLIGGNVGRNPWLGLAVLEQAAASGYAPAQTELGRRYLRGLDVPADVSRGQRLLEAAAEAGDAGAMFHLARAYLNGHGIARNMPDGVDWLRRAADAGSDGAKLELGRRYLRGLDVPVDVDRGRGMLETLATAGHAGAMLQLGTAYANGYGVTLNPARARDWLSRAAQSGNVEARRLL